MAVSQNGWPVNPPRRSRTVPGTNVKISVADGPAGDVLMYVASQFDKRVEDIDNASGTLDDWGWADRPIRGSAETSNHASATAIDLNAPKHPLGKRGTFSAPRVAEIREILSEVEGVVRWGGDYTRPDEMHFEINAPHNRVHAVAARLNATEDDVQLTDKIPTWDGKEITVAQALAGAVGHASDARLAATQMRDAYIVGGDGFGAAIFTDNPGTPNQRSIRVRDLLAEYRTGIAGIRGQVAGVLEALGHIAAGKDVDLTAVLAAAKAGTKEALAEGTVNVDIEIGGRHTDEGTH